jgi:alkyl sulfatase BDS1-like metallo-beta-lactamase superfamily hydrolase
MRWVYERTIEGAKQHMTPDELVEYAALPERFASLDYLSDYYGSVPGTIRQIYAQRFGWFDGDPLNLHRENPLERSQRMAEWLGGADRMMALARSALDDGDALGAAQLAQHVVRLRPNDAEPKLLMADALDALGADTLNTPVRHYSFSYANRLRRESGED